MSKHIFYVEQGRCAKCGSYDVKPTNLDGGRPGENLLVFFVCNECGCSFIECYEYACKGVEEEA